MHQFSQFLSQNLNCGACFYFSIYSEDFRLQKNVNIILFICLEAFRELDHI